MPHLIQPGAGEHSTHRSAARLRDQADNQSDEGLEGRSGKARPEHGQETGQRARYGGAGKHRRITFTRVMKEPSMLSSSPSKIHEPRHRRVPTTATADQRQKLRNTRGLGPRTGPVLRQDRLPRHEPADRRHPRGRARRGRPGPRTRRPPRRARLRRIRPGGRSPTTPPSPTWATSASTGSTPSRTNDSPAPTSTPARASSTPRSARPAPPSNTPSHTSRHGACSAKKAVATEHHWKSTRACSKAGDVIQASE